MDEEQAVHRLKAAWQDMPDLYGEIGRRIHPLAGDFTCQDLALSSETIEKLPAISHVFHIGAETEIQKSREELEKINLEGTRQVLSFAEKLSKKHALSRFVFVSTAYTAGLKSGVILAEDPRPEEFSSYYEKSKAEAEKLVLASSLPCTICRPGMIVGHSKTGHIRRFNTVYYVLKLLLQGKLPVLPVSKNQRLNLVPVDYVADAVTRLAFDPAAKMRCFHLTAPDHARPTAEELCDYVLSWAKQNLRLDLKKPAFLPLPALKNAGLSHNRKTEAKKKSVFSNLLALMPYFYDDHVFSRTGTDALLGPFSWKWKNSMDALLTYACRQNFLHQTERTVFEQILYRLDSKSAPVSYFDVTATEVRETSAADMKAKIEQIRVSLLSLGIRKGDKVALTGKNCTEYFALDIAIGLCGGVSVPIYYTTPAAEVDLLLQKSGAKCLFVGDRRIGKQLDQLTTTVPIIVFAGAEEGLSVSRSFYSWSDFVAGKLEGLLKEGQDLSGGKLFAKGQVSTSEKISEEETPEHAGASSKIYVDPDDLCTIRYTSGTTGEPKGVCFSERQLTFMGQVLTALLPWKEKQKEMRYLSFLPLSHVVEGILASYAPYYMHCPVKYYYLNDFNRLTDALPQVQPTVFFSVPRFYEKLWQQIEDNPVGKRYLANPESVTGKLLGRLLKRVALKKAGLSKCSQLIVGSAPISEELLLKFRALGIEIHNAYGQTEAPLITINRIGDNVIPSIGTPLPDTEVTVQPDGELIVKGPQVCLGYYGLQTDTIKDGVLKTGDLGHMDASGHIYLAGRKKEMIITSYGKNINCPKIEERMKNIPGVSEAVLIGENRPYCTALLWLEEGFDDSHLEADISRMNEALSHPEQIRKWAVIRTPLSIQKGELTPNLKVKRKVVEEHYKEEIQGLYKS